MLSLASVNNDDVLEKERQCFADFRDLLLFSDLSTQLDDNMESFPNSTFQLIFTDIGQTPNSITILSESRHGHLLPLTKTIQKENFDLV